MNRIEINMQTGEQKIVELTQDELDEIASRPVEPEKSKAKRQIDEIERNTLMNRAVREFMILSAEAQAAAQGVTPVQLYAANPAYKSVKDVDTQVTALRAKLK
jgi:hypothetical protein